MRDAREQCIDHVAVVVRDADVAGVWWAEKLNLKPLHDEELLDLGVRLVYFDAGNTSVQLVQPIGPGAIADYLATRGEGLHHICFAVRSIPAELTRLEGPVQAPIFRGGRGRRACFLTQRPNNVQIELTEHAPIADAVPW